MVGSWSLNRNMTPPQGHRLIQVRVAALLVGAILNLSVLEILLRVRPFLGVPLSVRREHQWRSTHTSEADLLTQASHSFDQYSPILGWELKPGLHTPAVTSNSVGLRGTKEYEPTPPPGVHRILFMGDSFVFGENLSDQQTVPAQLERVLDRDGKWEVLNLAVHGYGTDQQWLRLQHLGFRYHADLVILGFFEADLFRNILPFRDYAKPYFELKNNQLVLRNVPVPSPLELLSTNSKWPQCPSYLWCHSHWWIQTLLESPRMPWPGYSPAERVTLAILDRMRDESRAHGMEFLLMIISRRMRDKPNHTESLLLQWAQKSGTPVLNLRNEYLRLPVAARHELFAGHWTPYGATVTAEILATKIHEMLRR
jgi:hypothetical protein